MVTNHLLYIWDDPQSNSHIWWSHHLCAKTLNSGKPGCSPGFHHPMLGLFRGEVSYVFGKVYCVFIGCSKLEKQILPRNFKWKITPKWNPENHLNKNLHDFGWNPPFVFRGCKDFLISWWLTWSTLQIPVSKDPKNLGGDSMGTIPPNGTTIPKK